MIRRAAALAAVALLALMTSAAGAAGADLRVRGDRLVDGPARATGQIPMADAAHANFGLGLRANLLALGPPALP